MENEALFSLTVAAFIEGLLDEEPEASDFDLDEETARKVVEQTLVASLVA